MYQLTNILEEINCDILEYAYLTEDTHHTSKTFKLYIPKLMAPMGFGSPRTWNEGIRNIFQNDSACKISHSTSISLQNYVVVERHLDTDFKDRARSDNKLNKGQRFILTFMNHDPRDCKILKIT